MTTTSYHIPVAKFAILALCASAALAPAAAHAFVTPSADPLFSAPNLVPGGSVSGSFTVQNPTGGALTAAIQLTNPSGDFGLFADEMTFSVAGDASASGDLGDLQNQLQLSGIPGGETRSYTLTLTLKPDAPQLPLMGKSFGFDLCIGFEGSEVQCGITAFPTSTPSQNNGGSQNTIVRRGGGGFAGAAFAGGEVLGAETCAEYLQAYIRQGARNDPAEVTKLQQFLRDLGGFPNLPVTGVYDAATVAAVRSFQRNYTSAVLSPWGIAEPTGYVYYTTRKAINELYCKFTTLFPLSAAQLAEIERVRAQGIAWTPESAGQPASSSLRGIALPGQTATSAPADTGEVAGTSTAPERRSWWSRLWDWLFGR